MTSEPNYFVMVYEHFKETVASLLSYGTCKSMISFIVAAFGVLVGVENYAILISLGILVVIDFLTGMMASLRKGEAVTSIRAMKTVTKIVVFLLLFAAANHTGKVVPGMYEFVTTGVISFLALTEFISIAENVARMGYAIPRRLLNQIKPDAVAVQNACNVCKQFGTDQPDGV